MKEQTRYNKTPEQGWAKMKPVLDQVMPESKPTKRLTFLWWAASAVIVSGALGVLLMDGTFSSEEAKTTMPLSYDNSTLNKQSDSKPLTDQMDVEGVAVEQKDMKAASNEDENQIPVNFQNQPDIAENITTTTGSTATIISESKNTNKNVISASVIAINEVTEDYSGSSNVIANETNSGSEVILEEAIEDSGMSENFALPQRSMVVVEPLIFSSVPMISNEGSNSRQFTFSEAHTKAKRNPVWFRPTLAVSSLFGQNGGLGVYGGAGVDVNFSRRFSLTTVFGYSSYIPNANFLGSSLEKLSFNEQSTIINTDPLSGLDNYVYSESINVEADYNAINPLVESVSQWQVDIGLNWRFSRRFYASGGVKFGFKTEAYSQYPIVRGGPLVIPTYPPVELGNSLSDYNVIRNSSTSIFVGFGYRISRHFDVLANWTHGFDQYVLNAENIYTADLSPGERTDYIRGLTIGLKYTL
jgi:hypothetical protein